MAILTLYPFSISEFSRKEVNFIDKFWNRELKVGKYKNTKLLKKISNQTLDLKDCDNMKTCKGILISPFLTSSKPIHYKFLFQHK